MLMARHQESARVIHRLKTGFFQFDHIQDVGVVKLGLVARADFDGDLRIDVFADGSKIKNHVGMFSAKRAERLAGVIRALRPSQRVLWPNPKRL